MNSENERLLIRPFTKKELAGIYQISPRAFSSWIKPFETEIGKKMGRFYTVKQVRLIIEKLGLPGTVGE